MNKILRPKLNYVGLCFVTSFILLLPHMGKNNLFFPKIMPISLSVIFLLLSCIYYVLHALFSNSVVVSLTLVKDTLIIGLMFTSILVSTYISIREGMSEVFKVLSLLAATYIIIVHTAVHYNNTSILIKALVLSLFISSLIAIGQSFFDLFLNVGRPLDSRTIATIDIPGKRSAGPFGSYGSFGVLLLTALPILIYQIIGDKSNYLFSENLDRLILFILLTAVFISQTRSVWANTIIVLSLIWIENNIKLTKEYFSAVIPISVILSIVIILPKIDLYTLMLRIKSNLAAIAVFLNNPYLGVGFQNFLDQASNSGINVQHGIHHLLFKILATSGIAGLIPLLVLIMGILRRSIQLISSNSRYATSSKSVAIGMIGVLNQAQFYPALYSQEFWLAIGLLTAVYVIPFRREDINER